MPKRRFGPPPPSDLTVEPTADEVARFAEDGFLVVDRITTDEEIEWLRPIFEAAFAGVDAGKVSDEAGSNPKVAYQTMCPELRFPELLETTFVRNAHVYAAALLQVDASSLSCWGHMIRKPAVGSRLAPWHQDEAYWEPELSYHTLGAWLPLHDVDVGCMQFIPGSHKLGVLHHEFYDDDPVHNLLEVVGVDTSHGVACPLRAGGATFHHQRTLHYTAPNTTGRTRMAFPVEFQTMPQPVRDVPDRPWVEAHRAATGSGRLDVYIADGAVLPAPT